VGGTECKRIKWKGLNEKIDLSLDLKSVNWILWEYRNTEVVGAKELLLKVRNNHFTKKEKT
jgi:hypothetical protein